MTKDAWDIAVDVAQILSAIGTCGAVIVSLYLASRGRKPKARVLLDVHNAPPFGQSKYPTEGRLVVTNVGDREAVVLAARWRVIGKSETEYLAYDHYPDDDERTDLTWAQLRPGKPYPFTIPYKENTDKLRKLLGVAGEIPLSKLRDVFLAIEFSTGHVHKERLPRHVADEISRFSEFESRKL